MLQHFIIQCLLYFLSSGRLREVGLCQALTSWGRVEKRRVSERKNEGGLRLLALALPLFYLVCPGFLRSSLTTKSLEWANRR